MKKFLSRSLLAAALLSLPVVAYAQDLMGARVVSSCGGQSLTAGDPAVVTVDLTGKMCSGGTATISGTVTVNGATSNATDAQATTSTNVPSVSYNYGWNGTGWDRVQVDGSKFLKTVISGALPAGSALIGKAGIDQTTPGTTNNVTLNGVTENSASLTVSSATTILTQDMTGFTSIMFEFTSAGASNQFVVESSNDNATWVQSFYLSVAANPSFSSLGQFAAATVATTNTYVAPKTARYMRIRVSTYTSGTVTMFYTLSTQSPGLIATASVATGNVGSAQADAGNPVKIGGVYTTGPTAVTNGQRVNTWSDQFGDNGWSPQCGGCVFETASATGTTAATTATLAAAASKTTYICGFSIRAVATAATVGNATVTGTITGTLNFEQGVNTVASGLPAVTEPSIGHACVPASATNQAIAVVSAAGGTGGVVSVTAWGFQQ